MNNLVNIPGPSLLDASYFTQVMTLADVMANSSLLPKTLITSKDEGNKEVLLPIETVKANCFLIANQAFKWKADPFAVAAACSVVHGRLMFEGKLVHAILEANLGIKLRIKFGKWDAKADRCDLSEEGAGEQLAARIYEELPGGSEGRFVDGFVGGWKTSGNNTPWRPGTYRKQMLYRGTREWARWFEPGVMIGVITDDEMDLEPKDITPKSEATADGVLARLQAKKTIDGDGFDAERVKTETKESAATTSAADDEAASPDASSEDKAVDVGTSSAAASSETKANERQEGEGTGAAGSAADEGNTSQASSAASDTKPDSATAKQGNAAGAEWLKNITRMLWAATTFNGDAGVLKAQRKAAAASYPADGIDEKWTKKAGSVFDRCMDIQSGALDPSDGVDMIAGLAGLESSELNEIWKKRK